MTEDEHELVFDLSQEKYWDIRHHPNGSYRVETRMEYDLETCKQIKSLVIRAFNINLPNQRTSTDIQNEKIVGRLRQELKNEYLGESRRKLLESILGEDENV